MQMTVLVLIETPCSNCWLAVGLCQEREGLYLAQTTISHLKT